MTLAEITVPSPPRRSVKVTFVAVLPGFTIATPRLRDRRPLTVAKSTVWVVTTPGRTPACVAPKPKVSKTTNPPVEGEVWAKAGVDKRQAQRTMNNNLRIGGSFPKCRVLI